MQSNRILPGLCRAEGDVGQAGMISVISSALNWGSLALRKNKKECQWYDICCAITSGVQYYLRLQPFNLKSFLFINMFKSIYIN